MVNIGLLAWNFKTYSNKRLIEEGKKARHNILKIKPKDICLFIDNKLTYSIHKKNSEIQVILPRFGDLRWDFSLMALQHFENMGIPTVNTPYTEAICKNKFLTNLALRKKRIPQPKTALALSEQDMIKHIKNIPKPLVIKLLDGSFGEGISRINDDVEAEDWIETISTFKVPIYIQEYIPNPGEDYRVFIVDNKIIGSMKRKAKPGQWKANISLGATPFPYNPSEEVKEISLKSAQAVKAEICGVDLMMHDNQIKVIEVNHNPAFEGLEKVSKKNIAREIIKLAARKAKR